MKAYELLDGPDRWTQGAAARTAGGEVTNTGAEDARRWCLVGFLWRAYGILTPEWNQAVGRLHARGIHSPADWNDDPERRWHEVRDLLKELDL